jgi:arginyl-tRNA synthetase
VQDIKNFLFNSINKIFSDSRINEVPEIRLSNLPEYDLQINNLLRISDKNIKKKIVKLLNELNKNRWIDKLEITEKGFVNIKYSHAYLEDYINCIQENINILIYTKNPKSYLLDYGGVNIGKSMHVGHIRSLNIGRGIKNLLKTAGHNVISDIHLGDWGMPVSLILNYCMHSNTSISDLTVESLEDIYPKSSELAKVNNEFLESAKEINKSLNSGNSNFYKDWETLYEISTSEIKKTLSMFNHEFDIFEGESDANKYIEPLLNRLKSQKKIVLDNGAFITKLENRNVLITKSDGSYLYITTDLGTIVRREEEYNIDSYIYIVDQRQKKHFEDLFECVKEFDLSNSEFIHIGYGTVNNKDGKPLKTREGDNYKLTKLYDDVENKFKSGEIDSEDLKSLTNSVLTYSDLQTNRITDYKFDIEKFTSTEGNTAVYLQYTYARSKKIISDNDKGKDFTNYTIPSSSNEIDLDLLRELIKLPEKFKLAEKTLELNHIADYAYELCKVFNKFYSKNKINSSEAELKDFRLQTIKSFVLTLEFLFSILGIRGVKRL